MTDLWKGLGVISVFLTLTCVATCDNYQVVNTKSGPVKGIFSQQDKGIIYKFLKIPFAKPPVGNLRFSKPEPMDPWNDVIDATDYPPSCIQHIDFLAKYVPTLVVSEDCLFLSVYVPNEVSSANKKAVMVWIYGGGYYVGQSSMYDGSHLALSGDVIVVTMNYRLNVFGFLSTWDSAAPGNYGLWDQILALQWVKNNIETFGGNPESVTIFGESAGGFSVSLLSLMPRNKGLFHRVIAQSGTAISPIAYNEKNKSYMQGFLGDVGCEGKSDSSLIVECLRQMPAEKLIDSSYKSFMDGLNNDMILPFSPRIDNDLINDDPANILMNPESQSSQFMQSLDYMSGFTDKEWVSLLFSFLAMFPNDSFNATEGLSTKFLCQTFARKLSTSHYNDRFEITDAICERYSVENGDTTNKIEQANRVIDCFGDFLFGGPCIGSLNEHIKTNNLRQAYQYVFSRPFDSVFDYKFPDWFEGAPHVTEIPYLFGVKQLAGIANFTAAAGDFRLADLMMKYWTNFAKTGNPNSESLPNWPRYTSEEMEFMNLNFESKSEMASSDFKKRMDLWLNYIPSVVGKTSYHEEL